MKRWAAWYTRATGIVCSVEFNRKKEVRFAEAETRAIKGWGGREVGWKGGEEEAVERLLN